MIRLSTTLPAAAPSAPPIVAAETPKRLPPMEPPRAAPAEERSSVAMAADHPGKRKAATARRRQGSEKGSRITPVVSRA